METLIQPPGSTSPHYPRWRLHQPHCSRQLMCSSTGKSWGIQAIMKNTTMDSFNHQVSVKYLYKKNLTELGENYNDATKRIPTYNFLMSATSTSTMVRMTTDSSMRTNTGLTNPAEPGDRILHPSPPGTPSFHPSSVPLSSRALPLPKKQLSPPIQAEAPRHPSPGRRRLCLRL